MDGSHSPLLTLATSPAAVVAVGGLDPGGGAGILRDFVTATALGGRAWMVGTAWTVQSPAGVRGFEPRAPSAVAEALRAALAQAPRGRTSVKVGMPATPHTVASIVNALEGFDGPVVFDPVLAATSGGALFDGTTPELLPLVRRAWLVTPNLAEAAVLAGMGQLTNVSDSTEAARRLRAAGARAVLVKGGHLEGAAVDVFVDASGVAREWRSPRIAGRSPRGTGCALATAIALGLAEGKPVEEAIDGARAWLLERIREARTVGDERHL